MMTATNVLTTLISLFSFTLLCTSCQVDKNLELTEEEAVEIIETSVQKNSGGMVESIEAYTEKIVTDTNNTNCNFQYQDSFNFNFDNTAVTAAYAVDWTYSFSCNSFNVPTMAQFNLVSTGTYQSNRLNGADNITANIEVSGLDFASADVLFNGNYTRLGSQEITTNFNSRSLTSTLGIAMNDISVSKTAFQIQSGSAQVILTGTDQENSFNYSGTLVFNGGGSATLNLNGNSYTIDLNP